MNVILETHAVIWFITEDKQLPDSLKSLIENSENDCFVSVASLWEIGIKYSLGKLDLNIELKK